VFFPVVRRFPHDPGEPDIACRGSSPLTKHSPIVSVMLVFSRAIVVNNHYNINYLFI
jgi:hypothetical protein